MSIAEIVYRLRKAVFILIQRLGLLTAGKVPAVKSSCKANSFIKETKHVKAACYLQAADEILQGHLPVFALQDNEFSPYFD